MAYQIKTIRYQSNARKILLQNINGPCPLLAAANALLLRGVITLSSECIRNGVASTDDVVNMLANRALIRSQQQQSSSSTSTDDNTNNNTNNHQNHEEYHLNEVLSLLPTLQHGMDVNPQFTSPQSIEYTNNLATFDLLGVELVHGWVVDPQDLETCAVVENKSYNELIELVIGCGGEEGRNEMKRLEELRKGKEEELRTLWVMIRTVGMRLRLKITVDHNQRRRRKKKTLVQRQKSITIMMQILPKAPLPNRSTVINNNQCHSTMIKQPR